MPVTIRTLRIAPRQLSSRLLIQCLDEADHRGHHLRGRGRKAIGPDLVANIVAAAPVAAIC